MNVHPLVLTNRFKFWDTFRVSCMHIVPTDCQSCWSFGTAGHSKVTVCVSWSSTWCILRYMVYFEVYYNRSCCRGVQALCFVKHLETIVLFWRYTNWIELKRPTFCWLQFLDRLHDICILNLLIFRGIHSSLHSYDVSCATGCYKFPNQNRSTHMLDSCQGLLLINCCSFFFSKNTFGDCGQLIQCQLKLFMTLISKMTLGHFSYFRHKHS